MAYHGDRTKVNEYCKLANNTGNSHSSILLLESDSTSFQSGDLKIFDISFAILNLLSLLIQKPRPS